MKTITLKVQVDSDTNPRYLVDAIMWGLEEHNEASVKSDLDEPIDVRLIEIVMDDVPRTPRRLTIAEDGTVTKIT